MTILNVPVRPNGVVINPGVRGYGVQFSDSSGDIVKAMVMLRLFDPERKSPYADVVNARFGFELPMKKKVRMKVAGNLDSL